MTKAIKVSKLDETRYHDYQNIVVKVNELIEAFNEHYHMNENNHNTTKAVKGFTKEHK